jgi:uncharacterized membrane protein YdbT with pleckstrin-like domain
MTENSNDPNVVYFARLHWILFLGPVLSLILSLVFTYYLPSLQMIGLLFAAFSLLWIAMTWVTYYFSSLTIKKKQVILRTGIIVRQTIDVPLSKIESIDIRQSLIGSIFGYGVLMITGTGGTRQMVNYLQKPLTCRRYIEQLMNEQ